MTNTLREYECTIGGEEVTRFSDDHFTVDGIDYDCLHDTTTVQSMFMIKYDVGKFEEHHVREDGYMQSEMAKWSSPYSPLAYRHGDVDEEVWLRFGFVLGPDDYDYEYYKAILREEAAEARQVI